jgi:hypothetical protein
VARSDDAVVGDSLLIDRPPPHVDDVRTDGNVRGDVAVLDRSGLNRQQPWQMEGTTLPVFTMALPSAKTLSLTRNLSGFAAPPGKTSAS